MTAFPLAATLQAARAEAAPRARTEDEAATLAGGPVFLSVEELPEAFATPEDAEAAAPGLYGSGLYELIWRDGAWRVAMRYWRPAPPAPVGRTLGAAMRGTMGTARTPDEARARLGGPAELVQEVWPKLYVDHRRLLARWGEQVRNGLGEIVEREGKFAAALRYWRPMGAGALAPAERAEIEARVSAPLRGLLPQAPLDIGLFERVAPENPDIILAEEGDGRFHGGE